MNERFRSIMVAVDFSTATDDLITVAARFAENYQARVLLINVLEPGYAFSGLDGISLPLEDLAALENFNDNRRVGLQEKIDQLVNRLRERGLEAEGRLVEGHPASTIVEEAENEKVDAVFVGSHGWSGIKKFLMGSVADSVVKNCGCSVMVVRGAEATA